jgi:hypothetical protein
LNLRKKTILRRKGFRSDVDTSESLDEFFHDKVWDLVSDELEMLPQKMDPTKLYYEPIWTRSCGENFIKSIRINIGKPDLNFKNLDITIVEAYNLDMIEIISFFMRYNATKIKFKKL